MKQWDISLLRLPFRIIKNPTRGRVKVISISSVLTTGADIEGDIVERYVIAVI
ncbi:TPA: hypothetical protein SMH97_003902 [Serratia marcescens]|uniref:hypothetical protein n=1 Tax=Serratia marcescens TaxID=615 RepID=UPI0027E43427|nr:hypothetical protein [Serratia marcescens]HEJ7836407.1 hypothetical protein [Serratia marcescens]